MQLSDFSYHLPDSLIAQEPASPRDHSRLMLVNRETQQISHHYFYELPDLLPHNYSVIANNTKVFPARLLGHKSTGGKVEILLLSPLGHSRYTCLARPRLKQGAIIIFTPDFSATITHTPNKGDYEHQLEFSVPERDLKALLAQHGTMPTPPYIKKFLEHQDDYQTIYAKYGFSAAAPTAGLHFTPELLKRLKQNHSWHELTLNVGLGTFLPVKTDDILKHHMHSEDYTITQSLHDAVETDKQNGQKILAIGTTTTRALESSPHLTPGHYSTEIFLYPPYQFQAIDALLTNFHLPGSTLLMLVSAFASSPNTNQQFTTFKNSLIGRAYKQAVELEYRFFSFGDAMLII